MQIKMNSFYKWNINLSMVFVLQIKLYKNYKQNINQSGVNEM